jgi:hypothetical protein
MAATDSKRTLNGEPRDGCPLWVDVVEKVGHERVEALYWAFADQF